MSEFYLASLDLLAFVRYDEKATGETQVIRTGEYIADER